MAWLLALTLFGAPVGSEEAVALIRGSVERTRSILTNPELRTRGARVERLRQLQAEANRLTDWPGMARLCAGPLWRVMDEGQRARFVRAFEQLLLSYHLLALDRAHVGPLPELRPGEASLPDRRWVVMDLPLRFFPLEIGFLVNDTRRVTDVRAAGFRLSSHAQETLRRVVERRGLEPTLRLLEGKAAAARRQVNAEQVFQTER